MPVDPKLIADQASRVNLTPSVLWALGQQANSYGSDPFTNEIAARQGATALGALVTQHGSIEKALSVLHSGDPNAYASPTHPAAGYVAGVLGLAGSQATYGMDHFAPTDVAAFSGHANDVHEVFDAAAQLGGVVTHEGVAAFANAIAAHSPPPVAAPGKPAPSPKPPAKPSGPDPKSVAEFQQQASSLGIDPDHLTQNLPFVAMMMRKNMGKSPTLEDYSPMAQMNQQEMQAHINSLPHPNFPEITVGAYHSAYAQATLQSIVKVNSMPSPFEVSRFAALGHDPKQISAYYDARQAAENPKPVAPAPVAPPTQPTQTGQQPDQQSPKAPTNG